MAGTIRLVFSSSDVRHEIGDIVESRSASLLQTVRRFVGAEDAAIGLVVGMDRYGPEDILTVEWSTGAVRRVRASTLNNMGQCDRDTADTIARKGK